MLPPAGHIFEKLHLLENFVYLPNFFVTFKYGSSRGAASGGSDFWKIALPCVFFAKFVMPFKQGSSMGAASGGSDF